MARNQRAAARTLSIAALVITAAVIATTASAINPSDWDRDDAKAHEAYLAAGGSATQRCLGKVVTISSTAELVQGTSGNDVIVSRYYNAQVNGGDGDDIICAYNLDVDIYGGNGNDVIWADGNANQRLMGSGGNDVLFGLQSSPGHSQYFNGGTGTDKFYGSRAADQMFGHDGNDSFYAGYGNDILNGGNGNDTVRGQDGDDSIDGDAGTDILCGGAGANRFYVDVNGEDVDFNQGDVVIYRNGATRYDDVPSC